MRQAGYELAPIWDANIIGSSLSNYATTLAPPKEPSFSSEQLTTRVQKWEFVLPRIYNKHHFLRSSTSHTQTLWELLSCKLRYSPIHQ